jgi:hypothetical protein
MSDMEENGGKRNGLQRRSLLPSECPRSLCMVVKYSRAEERRRRKVVYFSAVCSTRTFKGTSSSLPGVHCSKHTPLYNTILRSKTKFKEYNTHGAMSSTLFPQADSQITQGTATGNFSTPSYWQHAAARTPRRSDHALSDRISSVHRGKMRATELDIHSQAADERNENLPWSYGQR